MKKPLSALIGVALAFLTVSCIFFVPNTDAADSSADTWTQISRLPAECFMSLTVADGKIYAVSDGDHAATGIKVFVYDPKTNNWATQPASDVFYTDNGLDYNVATVLYQNKIYCFGLGYLYNFYKCYDAATNSWRQIASDPQLRHSASASLVNDKIYVIGGAIGGEWSPYVRYNTVEMYNPATDSWTTLEHMPEAISIPTSVVVDEKIYVFGAESGNVLIYDTTKDLWKTGPYNSNIVYFRGDGAATSGQYAPKKIYLFQANNTYIFDPATETWGNGAFIPESLQDFKVVVADDVFYLIGGGYGKIVTRLRSSSYEFTMADFRYVPADYNSVPLATESPKTNPSNLAFSVAGIIVAASVVGAVSLLLLHRKHKPKKNKLKT